MKYFTKEELEKITSKLLDKPTRETLKELNDEYNETNSEVSKTLDPIPNLNIPETKVEPIPNSIIEEQPETNVKPMPSNTVNPQVSTVPVFEVPSINVPEYNPVTNQGSIPSEIPNTNISKEPQMFINNQNSASVPFSGNLWEPQAPETNDLMKTTDNFNNNPTKVDIPTGSTPFFGETKPEVNNPIPISDKPNEGPTMFGEMQQNYNTSS